MKNNNKTEKIITIENGKRCGQPVIRGMRITVYDVLKLLASSMSFEEILSDYPKLTIEDIKAVLEFASTREHYITNVSNEITL